MVKKIKLTFEPEPIPDDPPDCKCLICGGVAHGWFVQNINEGMSICGCCSYPKTFRGFSGIIFEAIGISRKCVHHLWLARAALWHLEKEIDRSAP